MLLAQSYLLLITLRKKFSPTGFPITNNINHNSSLLQHARAISSINYHLFIHHHRQNSLINYNRTVMHPIIPTNTFTLTCSSSDFYHNPMLSQDLKRAPQTSICKKDFLPFGGHQLSLSLRLPLLFHLPDRWWGWKL